MEEEKNEVKTNENNKRELIEVTQKIEARKEKIKNWLKDPSNLIFIGIIIFAIAIRLYYFFLTKMFHLLTFIFKMVIIYVLK